MGQLGTTVFSFSKMLGRNVTGNVLFCFQEGFAAMIRNSGFRMVTYENLTFGVAAIHSGFKL